MSPTGWPTAEQKLHLQADVAKYCKYADLGQFERFWSYMNTAWFAKWPEEDSLKLPRVNSPEGRNLTQADLVAIGNATIKRKVQLKTIYRYARGKLRGISRKIDPASMGALLFRRKAKRSRKLQVIEVYQKDNKQRIGERLRARGYDQLNEETMGKEGGVWVDTETSDTVLQRMKQTNTRRMKMRREVVAEAWGTETEERKEYYRGLAAKQRKKGIEAAADCDGNDDELRRRPEALQASINELEGVLKIVHDAIEQKTGWKGVTVVGGPMPEKGGELVVESYCFGESEGGRNFSLGHPRWNEAVVGPAFQWLRQCFPRAERVKWAATTKENDMADIDTGGDSESDSTSDSGSESDSEDECDGSDTEKKKKAKKSTKKKPPQRRPRGKNAAPKTTGKGKRVARPLEEGTDDDLFGDGLLGGEVGDGQLGERPTPNAAYKGAQAAVLATAVASTVPENDVSKQLDGRLTGVPDFDFTGAPYSFEASFADLGDMSFGSGSGLSNGGHPSFGLSSGLSNGDLLSGFSRFAGMGVGASGAPLEDALGHRGGLGAHARPLPPVLSQTSGGELVEGDGVDWGGSRTYPPVPSFHPEVRSTWAAGVALAALGMSPARGSAGGSIGEARADVPAPAAASAVFDSLTVGSAGRPLVGNSVPPAPPPPPAPAALVVSDGGAVGLDDPKRRAERAKDAAAFDTEFRRVTGGGNEGSAGGRDFPESRPLGNPPKAAKAKKPPGGRGRKAQVKDDKKAKEGEGAAGEVQGEESEVQGEEVLTPAQKRSATMALKRQMKAAAEEAEAGEPAQTAAPAEDGEEGGGGRTKRTVRPPKNVNGERVAYQAPKRKRASEEGTERAAKKWVFADMLASKLTNEL